MSELKLRLPKRQMQIPRLRRRGLLRSLPHSRLRFSSDRRVRGGGKKERVGIFSLLFLSYVVIPKRAIFSESRDLSSTLHSSPSPGEMAACADGVGWRTI